MESRRFAQRARRSTAGNNFTTMKNRRLRADGKPPLRSMQTNKLKISG